MTTEDWFAELYRDGYRGVVLTGYALLGDLGEAEEVALRAFTAGYGCRARVARSLSPRAWIRRMAVRIARGRRLRRAALGRFTRREPVLSGPIEALGQEHRAVVALHLAGLPAGDVSSIMDIPVETVRDRLAQAGTEDELARLRDQVHDSLVVPEFERVVARHRQRTGRRRARIGAAAAILAVGAVVPVLRTEIEPVREATSGFISDVDFGDADHGYALRTTCRGRPAACTQELLATADGTHWQSRRLPRPRPVPSWAGATLRDLGPGEIAVDWPLSSVSETTRTYRMHSLDAGRTWRTVPVPAAMSGRVAEIPDHGALVPACATPVGDGQRCGERDFAVLLPGSARSARLANRPPLTAMVAGEVPTMDGRWWVAGRDRRTDSWGLAVSDDDGRTWTTTVLDWAEHVYQDGWSVVSAGGSLYASAIGALPDASNGLLGIFRSTDGGRTWVRTWRHGEEREPRRVYGNTVAAADGTLTINTIDGSTYSSRDGGRTFAEVPRRYPDHAYQIRTGYVANAITSSEEIETSPDGLRWRTIRIDPS